MSYLYHTFFYEPLYNGLILLLGVLPLWADMGMAIVLFTIIVKIILIPLSKMQIRTQIRMKQVEPKLKAIKELYKNNPQKLNMETLRLYREEKINPLSGIFLLLIQIPIILALYHIFLSGGLPLIKTDLLYSFIKAPTDLINMHFFGINLTTKSVALALLAAITQYIQMRVMMPALPKPEPGAEKTMATEFASMMGTQMKYVMPVMVLVAGYTAGAAISLYWVTSNIFGTLQEIFIRRKMEREAKGKAEVQTTQK